jgi:hypothetical protein
MIPINVSGSIGNFKFSLVNNDSVEPDGLSSNGDQTINCFDVLKNICNRFPLVAHQLSLERRDHTPFLIQNEYGVQHIFHALLQLYFDDIAPEEWTPNYAGSSTRMDFLLRGEEVAIELKMTRNGLNDKTLGNELIEDIAHYGAHPNCKMLIFFVYDPEKRISNPSGIEKDLNEMSNVIDVHVFIRPRLA